jgi:type IV pilus assembly protein PilY1
MLTQWILKNQAKPLIVMLGLALAGLALPTVAASQDACEVPLFVKQASGGANVMILADNSLSMNAAAFHPEYNRRIKWSGIFFNESTFYVAKDGWYEPNDFYKSWPSGPSVYLVNSDNGEDGWYDGNYMNWLYFHATDEQRDSVPRVTRIQVLKSVLDQIIDRSARLDFGLTVFQKNTEGGNIIGKCGVNHNSLRSQIAGITANAYTPLGESMETILDYFGDKNQSPIKSACQYNFILVVTDGLPTKDVDVSGYLHDADGDGNDPGNCDSVGSPYGNNLDCSDHVDDVAWWLANKDINSHIDGEQYAYTYVVGYNEDAQLLKDTAANGKGLYFQANNAVELFTSIEYALQDILRRISAGSAVAVVSTERGTDDRLYRGKFMPVDWNGYLECYALPYVEDDPAVWEAGELLRTRSRASRKIFTALGTDMYEFTTGNAAKLRVGMGAVDDAQAAKLISWGRGNDVAGYRDRQEWILGDIISSTPVVVGPPAEYVTEASYESFREANKNRRRMVYVGVNDGMVHGFDAETGQESWAFVPEFALPKFDAMADSFYCHTYTCDQTVTVKDAKVNGVWKTVMVSGGGDGGASLFALDITNPDSPSTLWQADLPNGKTRHSEVEVVSVAGKSVALVGSGLDVDNMEAYLYAFDLSTGNLLGSILLSSDNSAPRNKATRPGVVDVNLDGQIDLIYVADMLGSVHRISTGGDFTPANWTVTNLYSGDQEITADPVPAFGPNGSVYVYFGTGAYLEDADMTNLDPNSFLCVYDQHDGSTATMGNLTDQTSSVGAVGGAAGWYVNLWNAEGERVTQKSVVVAETVIFSAFAPSSDPCVAGGNSWLYQMRYDDGGIPDVDGMDDEADRSVDIGEGIASYPVVDLSEGNAVVQSSDASISVEPIAGIIRPLRVRSWQESYDHVEEPAAAAINN